MNLLIVLMRRAWSSRAAFSSERAATRTPTPARSSLSDAIPRFTKRIYNSKYITYWSSRVIQLGAGCDEGAGSCT